MRFTAPCFAPLLLATLELASAVGPPMLRPRQYDTKEYYALKLSPHAVPQAVAGYLGLDCEGPLGQLDDHYLFSGPLGDRDVVAEYRRRRKAKRSAGEAAASDAILFSEKQKLKRLYKRTIPPPPPSARLHPHPRPRQASPPWGSKHDLELAQELVEIGRTLDIQDPIFQEQWHLFNTVDKGHDVNVTGLWLEGVTGRNTTVAIVDDGLDMYSDDLKANYVGFSVFLGADWQGN